MNDRGQGGRLCWFKIITLRTKTPKCVGVLLPTSTSDTLGNKPWTYFSAVCWLYGKRLYDNLKYPIGLVASTWRGTPVEAWTDKPTLKKCGVPTTGGHV